MNFPGYIPEKEIPKVEETNNSMLKVVRNAIETVVSELQSQREERRIKRR